MTVYSLVNKKQEETFYIEVKDDNIDKNDPSAPWALMGKVFNFKNINEFGDPLYFAEVYIKRDLCTHWNFYGEDYDEDNKKSLDGYYHLCGGDMINDFILGMCFVIEVAHMYIKNIDEEEYKTFHDAHMNELKDYTITKKTF